MRILKNLSLYAFIIFCLSACSVGLAAKGKKTPDFDAFSVGSSKSEVELQLGRPSRSARLNNGKRVDIYQYYIGNERSPKTATFHCAMDLLTLGLWEIVATPIELSKENKYEITILYDKDDNIETIIKCGEKPNVQNSGEKKKNSTKIWIIGTSNYKNDGIQNDRIEAIIDAKRQAWELSNVELTRELSDKHVIPRHTETDLRANTFLAPGYEIHEIGYRDDDRKYFQVLLIGEITPAPIDSEEP